jgi:hypothetical protein
MALAVEVWRRQIIREFPDDDSHVAPIVEVVEESV